MSSWTENSGETVITVLSHIMLVSRESYTVFWNITFELESGAMMSLEHNFVS